MSGLKWIGWPIPRNTCLGQLELEHVFVFVDIPLFFICKNNNQRFVAICIDDNQIWHEFLYVELSKERYDMIIAKQVDFHDAFIASEAKTYLLYAKNNNNCDIVEIANNDIKEDWLPFPGEYYDS